MSHVELIEFLKQYKIPHFHKVDLSKVSNWKTGGLASLIVEPTSEEQLKVLMERLNYNKNKYLIIGDTTNLLFTDSGVKVPIIKIGRHLEQVYCDDTTIIASAGVWAPQLARIAMKHGLHGFEHICGIPGTLGGLVTMNGGSQRKSISDNIKSVRSVDRFGKINIRKAEECLFSYRSSIYQTNNEIIVSAEFALTKAKKSHIRTEMIEILRQPKAKFPLKQPNFGSVFRSDPRIYHRFGPPGVIFDKLKLKGRRVGNAEISKVHSNFIVNLGGAKSADILKLISFMSESAYTLLNTRLAVEVLFVSQNGDILPADFLANSTDN